MTDKKAKESEFVEQGAILVSKGLVYSKCHKLLITKTPIYWPEGKSFRQIGITYFCPYDGEWIDRHRRPECFKIVPWEASGKTFKLNEGIDPTTSIRVAREINALKWQYGANGGGVYFSETPQISGRSRESGNAYAPETPEFDQEY